MDVHTSVQRSGNMAAVKSRGNKTTELKLIQAFRSRGIVGWRRNSKVIGRPDFVFPKNKIAIFVDGCFWHGCKMCKTIPRQNRSFWLNKIQSNKKRDAVVAKGLRRLGWTVLRIWEHDLKTDNNIDRKLSGVLSRI